MHNCIEVSRKFHADIICFFVAFLLTKKEIASKSTIFLDTFITEFF